MRDSLKAGNQRHAMQKQRILEGDHNQEEKQKVLQDP